MSITAANKNCFFKWIFIFWHFHHGLKTTTIQYNSRVEIIFCTITNSLNLLTRRWILEPIYDAFSVTSFFFHAPFFVAAGIQQTRTKQKKNQKPTISYYTLDSFCCTNLQVYCVDLAHSRWHVYRIFQHSMIRWYSNSLK